MMSVISGSKPARVFQSGGGGGRHGGGEVIRVNGISFFHDERSFVLPSYEAPSFQGRKNRTISRCRVLIPYARFIAILTRQCTYVSLLFFPILTVDTRNTVLRYMKPIKIRNMAKHTTTNTYYNSFICVDTWTYLPLYKHALYCTYKPTIFFMIKCVH